MTGTSRARRAAQAALLALLASSARAGTADVLGVRVECDESRACRFAVTVRHADEDSRREADRYEVLTPDGTVLAARLVEHPHGAEPYTLELADVRIPKGVHEVRIRAQGEGGDSRGTEVRVEIPE